MRAWQFTGTHQPLVANELPDPTPGPGQVIIDVKAAGLCHSDVGILEDEKWLALMPTLPVTPGHEIAGVITQVGEGVTDYAVGDEVAVWPMGQIHGYGENGGFGEKVLSDTSNLVRVPAGLNLAAAAAATDAGMTSHGAVIGQGKVTAGEKVAILGFGGLGQVAAQLVKSYGAELYVAELREELWDQAKEMGAVKVVKNITELKEDELDAVIDFAGFGTTTDEAIATVRRGGRVVLVGMGKLEAVINTYNVILGQVQLIGSNGGSKDDIEAVMKLLADGKMRLNLEETTWEKIPEGLDRLHDGKVAGRLVARY